MYFTSVWRRAAASEGGDLDFKKISENMLQEDFCENFYGLWWLFSCIYGGLGGENNTEMGTKICICLWAGSTAIFTEEKDLVTFFAYELLPLVDSSATDEKGRYQANAGRGLHSFL